MDLATDHQSLCFRLVEHLLLHQNNPTLSPELLGCPPFFWRLFCTSDVTFRISQTSSKFGQVIMKNEQWDVSQSETEKYFERIIMYPIIPLPFLLNYMV